MVHNFKIRHLFLAIFRVHGGKIGSPSSRAEINFA